MLGATALYRKPRHGGEEVLAFTEELSQAAAGPEDTAATAANVLKLALACTAAEKGSLLLKEHDRFHVLAGHGMSADVSASSAATVGTGIAGKVARLGTPVMVENIEQDDRFCQFRTDRYKTGSFICCPIHCGTVILGILNINDKTDGSPFTVTEFLLIRTIANLAAVVLRRAILERKYQETFAALKTTHMRLAESNLARARFLMRLSHELRTPLNAVRGAVFYLQGRNDTSLSDQREFSAIIASETAKLGRIVENLQRLFLVENRLGNSVSEVLNLHELLTEAFESASLMVLTDRRIPMLLEVPPDETTIVGDRVTAVQLLICLLLGLSGYAGPENRIRCSLRGTEMLTISLSLDRPLPENQLTGCFAAEDDLKCLLFSLAREAAEAQGWLLKASNIAGGCEFSLDIPAFRRP